MDVDIMSQEESKLKPPGSELDSSLISASATGRDHPSASLRRRHHPGQPHQYPTHDPRYPLTHTSDPNHSFVPTITDSQSSMEAFPVYAPQQVGGPDQVPPTEGYPGRLMDKHNYCPPEDESYEEDDQSPGMDVDEAGLSKPSFANREQLAVGDPNKGTSPKNFVYKLFQILSDPESLPYIHWTGEGREFTVTSQEEFASKVLLKYFKHSNFSSFVRQLNMYDFHKTNRAPRSQRGTAQHQLWIFSHARFIQNRPDLLPLIKRKAAEGAAAAFPAGEDQLLGERRFSDIGGLLSPPNGTAAVNTEAMIRDLQRENQEIRRRLLTMEVAYKDVATKLDAVVNMLRRGSQGSSPLDDRQSTRSHISAASLTLEQPPDEHISHFDGNVPSSLGQPFLQPSADTMSTSAAPPHPMSRYPSTQPSTFTSSPPTPGPSRSMVPPTLSAPQIPSIPTSSNPLETASMGGASSYLHMQHQSSTVSLPLAFVGIENLNYLEPGSQQLRGQEGEIFASAFPQTVPAYQTRAPLGGRGYTVARAPAKGGPLAAVPPKGQPPDSHGGGLYHR
ncbi:hypothetical protein FRB90_006422 [Tulasnella sp. 427]|nr:hypothetical protein FRB90_006422 [Tulasnella sp. 427]